MILSTVHLFSFFLSPEAKHLINWMLSLRSKDRPSLEEVFDHPWVTASTSGMSQILILSSSPRPAQSIKPAHSSYSSTPASSPGSTPSSSPSLLPLRQKMNQPFLPPSSPRPERKGVVYVQKYIGSPVPSSKLCHLANKVPIANTSSRNISSSPT